MFSFFSRSKPAVATINGQSIEVQPKETILSAALRNGIPFPHSCRVGGCATCKCKLLEGHVRQLTDATYILSDEDLDNGCILACQSVPKGDVRIEVDNDAAAAARKTRAKVLTREQLTHDIVRITVQLEEALPYRAGQFASLEFDALPDAPRSYSFASPPNPDGQTSFFIRKVPGGLFSTFAHDVKLTGERLSVEGPLGDFWLRPGAAPLLMIAGGSGLAPILAMLNEHLDEHDDRPVYLIFGARSAQDLYMQEAIDRLKAAWRAPFIYVPVLSAEPERSEWKGERGFVADFIPPQIAMNSDAYLCGPPPMVDSAVEKLLAAGANKERIRADRFTTLNDASATMSI